MNTNLIMYNRCIHQLKNDPNLYIVNDLFKDSSWIKYKNFYNTTYQGILNYLLEMSLVTRIAYTYYMSGEEVYEISPYYIKSLYQEMNFMNKYRVWIYEQPYRLKIYYQIRQLKRVLK